MASDQAARALAMLAHPAGKGRRDDQFGIDEYLAGLEVPPLDPFEEAASEVYADLLDLLVSKQADYGPDAINLSPGGALVGINVRMHDKLQRAMHLRRSGSTEAQHESLVDTYRDLANYGVIAVMVLEGTWPK